MCLLRMRSLLLVTFAAAVVAAGCGEGALSSPTAPSALPDSTALGIDAPSEDLASATGEFALLGGGKGQGGGSNSGSGKDKDKDRDRQDKDKSDKGRGGDGESHVDDDDDAEDDDDGEDNRGRRGSLSGFVTAVGTDSITIRGIIVKVTPTTVIRHGHRRLTLAQIAVGDHAQAKGIMSADRKTLTASEIKVEDTGKDNDDTDDAVDNEAEAEGLVAGLTGTCPAVTFTIGTTKVATNEFTKYEHITCLTLSGAAVEVKGMRQTDGSLLATKVQRKLHEVEGTASGLAGTCPSVTFTVGTTKVTTSSTTSFRGGTCDALMNLTKVKVAGVKQADGSIAATEVKLDLDAVEGAVSGVAGTCPNVSFSVGTTKVTANDKTTFTGIACTGLAGATVEVKGTRQTDGSIAAATVKLD